MKSAPWAKAIKAQQRAAKTSLETATRGADEAEAACKAASEAYDASKRARENAYAARYDAQTVIYGLAALHKLLSTGDIATIEAVLADADTPSDGPQGVRQNICISAKYAQIGKVRFGHAIVWSETARRCRAVWTTLVSQGVLPPLHELLSQLQEP